jgi:serine/threonine protein kinase
VSDRTDSVTDTIASPFTLDERDLVGTEVGDYVVDGELGRGGMSIVYAATHPMIGKRVAIKVLSPAMAKNPITVERFLQEARSVNRIGHPSIVDIFALGTLPDGRHYLVMDLLEGESLRQRVKRGALPPRDAMEIVDEIASALIAAHDKGFIHRDLKPDNVFLVPHSGRIDVKLLDFGLAKLVGLEGGRAYRTATGALLGTPDYMSPEQLRGSTDVDQRTDIFALGVMLCELLSGTRPERTGETTFERDLVEVVGAAKSVPHQLVSLVAHMTSIDPRARPSLAQIRATITSIAASAALARDELDSAPLTDSLTASLVGARPIVPTPTQGTPSLSSQTVRAKPGAVSLGEPPSAAKQVSGLRPSGSHTGTRLGVPPPPVQPPPRVSRRHPTQTPQDTETPAAESPRAVRESHRWLFVALALVLVTAVALIIVLVA